MENGESIQRTGELSEDTLEMLCADLEEVTGPDLLLESVGEAELFTINIYRCGAR